MSVNMVQQESERRLIDCLNNSSEKSFGEFYDCYAPLLLGFMMKAVDDKVEAEKLLSEVITDIWNHKTQFDQDTERLYSWVMKIARKHVKASHQKNTSGKQIQNANAGVSILHQSPSDQQNTALQLIYFKGYTFTETATTLNIPPNQLLTMLKQAIGQFKQPQL